MNILTIDTGTTNTRISLWRDASVIAQAHSEVGVRDTAITGSRLALQQAVRDAIASALSQAGMIPHQVDLALASGMITSNLGLHELPHVPVPAGLNELAQRMACVTLPDVFCQPIWFVPGVRNAVPDIGLHNCEAMDMMRGEEVEVMGALARLELNGPALLMLPGSHSKFVSIDDKNRITGCVTTLAGELLHILTHNTILTKSLDAAFASEINPGMLLAGAASSQKLGLGRACFNVRILEQFTHVERNDRANFLLGAVLGGDLLTLKNSSAIHMWPDMPVVIAGKPVLKEALALLLKNDDFFSGTITMLTDEQQAQLAGFGAIAVAVARGLITADACAG